MHPCSFTLALKYSNSGLAEKTKSNCQLPDDHNYNNINISTLPRHFSSTGFISQGPSTGTTRNGKGILNRQTGMACWNGLLRTVLFGRGLSSRTIVSGSKAQQLCARSHRAPIQVNTRFHHTG